MKQSRWTVTAVRASRLRAMTGKLPLAVSSASLFSLISLASAVAVTALPGDAFAAATACGDHYWAGTAPDITNAAMTRNAREVCFSAFGVMHSGVTRTPLWSAERLTRAGLSDARQISRVNNFHAESRLPPGERAELRDYVRSGYDRGHMAPSADMPDAQAQSESFSLSNMVPQNSENNRYLWAGIESSVRKLAQDRGELFVLTGPLFKGKTITQVGNRVMVPTQLYKVVYDPRRKQAGAYLVANEATGDYSVVSVAELETLAGIDFFPGMPADVKRTAMRLPAPKAAGGKRKRDPEVPSFREVQTMLDFLRTIIR
ncbi:DNA/RNA non-specific endonuclease [Pandoraea apista]|uniref:Endonuclease n=1 Tax=Pandoraea apista TaxID=93218 RepID=A0A5E5P1V4_9BURK|nr:DNA/RNA non-specific endonuclease [Pandoraea apista]VVG70153.1 DNA/RNA non-specific endonuclease [Pandoraea apista]